MSFAPVGWANDETHPVSQANMKTLDAASAFGWRPVDSGTVDGTTGFTITVPASTFLALRLSMHGRNTVSGEQVFLRINNDTTTGLHLQGATTWRHSDGTVIDNIAGAFEQWRLGEWSGVVGCAIDAHLFATDVSGRVGLQSRSTRNSTSAGNNRTSLTNGTLAADRLVSSLRVLSTDGGNFVNTRWWLEGYIAPP